MVEEDLIRATSVHSVYEVDGEKVVLKDPQAPEPEEEKEE